MRVALLCGRQANPVPAADASLPSRYIEHNSLYFIVMYNHKRSGSPTIASWFDSGIRPEGTAGL